MKQARNGDVMLTWEETGSGFPILLIQGLGYARWSWEDLVPQLADRHRVISFDNRGIGDSSKPQGPYSVAQMAGDALAVLDAAEVDRAHVVGASLGGMVAQELTLAHPERVDHLVLLCTTPGAPNGYPMPDITGRLFAEAETLEPEEALRRFVVNALGDDPDPHLVDRIVARRLASPPDPAGWAAQAAAGTIYSGGERVGRIASPTLIVTGTDDRVVDPRNSTLLGELIPESTVHSLDGVGHLLFLERPDLVGGLINDFLG